MNKEFTSMILAVVSIFALYLFSTKFFYRLPKEVKLFIWFAVLASFLVDLSRYVATLR